MTSLLALISFLFHLITPRPTNSGQHIATGHLPVVVPDNAGMVHLVYGQDSTIYYATANGQPTHFSPPVAVATLHHLVAGAKRGPQVAASDKYVVVTAANREGDLFAYSLDRRTGKWSPAMRINDVPEIAKEGFHALASASSGTFHTAWLDLRDDKRNKIVGTTSTDGGRTWTTNRLIYKSPSGSVCECCRVSIAARNNDVYVQFRNWLDGSRDLYLAQSADGGRTYPTVQKLGTGTWKLKGCPMDGGAVSLASNGQPITTWRRADTLYTCRPGESEKARTVGKNVIMTSGSAGNALAWDDKGTVWLQHNDNAPVALGKGQLPSVALTGKSAICVWEAEGQVMMETVALAK